MPEAFLQKMSDDDIRALFHFLSSDQIVATAVPVKETLTNFEHRKWFSSLVNGHQGSPTTSPLITPRSDATKLENHYQFLMLFHSNQ